MMKAPSLGASHGHKRVYSAGSLAGSTRVGPFGLLIGWTIAPLADETHLCGQAPGGYDLIPSRSLQLMTK